MHDLVQTTHILVCMGCTVKRDMHASTPPSFVQYPPGARRSPPTPGGTVAK